jgi:dTDP-4-dehydrorhamnose 3,5-epimerase
MIDMVLDVRKGSDTYGNIILYDMPAYAGRYSEWIWVPPGFAHGNIFMDDTLIEYLCTGEYSQGCEAGISPLSNDIDWSLCQTDMAEVFDVIKNDAIISDKDKAGLTLEQWTNDPRSENFIRGKNGV